MKTIVSVDPGASGGIAVCDPSCAIPIYTMGMPETEGDITGVFKDIHAAYERVAYVEEVGGYIGRPQPGSAMFKFGRNFGFILGVLQCSGFRIVLVKPQKWQKHFGFGGKKDSSTTDWKNKLKSEAQRLFPSIKVTLKVSDALLILAYAQHCEGNNKTFIADGKTCWFSTIPCETCFLPMATDGKQVWCSRGQCENESVQK